MFLFEFRISITFGIILTTIIILSCFCLYVFARNNKHFAHFNSSNVQLLSFHILCAKKTAWMKQNEWNIFYTWVVYKWMPKIVDVNNKYAWHTVPLNWNSYVGNILINFTREFDTHLKTSQCFCLILFSIEHKWSYTTFSVYKRWFF